ncbi:MAG: hypothetical protein MUF35_03225 [Candidatus Nanopelagicales bacterium]|jgi:hypothetical protein|nr:hypothetical protein [Candidatus Nanopelagicales bacterium]
MGHAVDRGEEYVVDMVVEVESRGLDVDALARSIVLPGVEVLRTTGLGMIWLTALVAAADEPAAIREVQQAVLGQLGGPSRVVVATVVTSAPLGDLYARLEAAGDDDLDRLDLIDLVEATMWGSGSGAARLRRHDTA